MTRTLLTIALTTCSLAAAVSADAQPAPAPDLTFLMAADMFASGQSNNIGPALSQVLDNHWIEGPCTAADGYTKCDSIRFGMTVFPPGSCAPTVNEQWRASEDGGKQVEARASSIHNEGGSTWCANAQFRPHDAGLRGQHMLTFPDGASASDDELDEYWERPRLNMMFIGDLPQTSNSTPGNRVIDTLRQACANFDGAGGILPAMPTWTFVTRKFDTDAVPYAGLVAAAGGTGACCYGVGCDVSTQAIDVCEHIEEIGRTDLLIRQDIKDGKYTCGTNGTSYGTGQLDFGSKNKGTLPEIRCHLVGSDNNDNCGGDRKDTDILGILSCVRQLPRGVTAADANILYCPTTDPADCVDLEDIGASIQWIDEKQTLFLIEGLESCDAISISTCEENLPCVVENALGRCRNGRTDCSTGREICVGLGGYPEICNGLDDDCDGRVDNISVSWGKTEFDNLSLPEDHAGIECNLRDVCMCPDGATDTHAGEDFDEYLDEWDPICSCGEGLAMSVGEPTSVEPADTEDDAAACTTSSLSARSSVFGALMLVVLGLIVRRRR